MNRKSTFWVMLIGAWTVPTAMAGCSADGVSGETTDASTGGGTSPSSLAGKVPGAMVPTVDPSRAARGKATAAALSRTISCTAHPGVTALSCRSAVSRRGTMKTPA
jgi:hypothetical protein